MNNGTLHKQKDLDAIYEKAKTKVTICCDECHAHSATDGCLSPLRGESEAWVEVCKLCELVMTYQRRIDAAAKVLK